MGLWESTKDKLSNRATDLTLEQQQKLCIARLLPLKPNLILMDEVAGISNRVLPGGSTVRVLSVVEPAGPPPVVDLM